MGCDNDTSIVCSFPCFGMDIFLYISVNSLKPDRTKLIIVLLRKLHLIQEKWTETLAKCDFRT